MLERDDYDWLSLVRFPRGVRKVVHRLFAERSISEPAYLAVKGDQIVQTDLTLRSLTETLDLTASGGPPATAYNGFAVEIDEPDAVGYLFYYHRLN